MAEDVDESRVDEALSSGLLVDPAPIDADNASGLAGDSRSADEPTQAVPMVVDADGADDGASADPFLDELRRATSEDEDDEALSKFLNDADTDEDDNKGGWFGRRKQP